MEKISKQEIFSRVRKSYDGLDDAIFSINRMFNLTFQTFVKLVENCSLSKNENFFNKMVKMCDSINKTIDTNNIILNENMPHIKELVLLDLTRKSSDLSHRQQLQQLLVNALNENDLNKAFLINSFLNPNQNQASLNSINQGQMENFLDLLNQVNQTKEKEDNQETEMIPINELPDTEMRENIIADVSTKETSDKSEDKLLMEKQIKPKLRSGPLSPIRHLICSPGLEEKAHKYKIIILYRGACNGYCYANKPWSKQAHLHYIVNTANCNDHISRLVKKQGIQFYNSFVLQSPDRWNQLIQLYKMEKVKQNS